MKIHQRYIAREVSAAILLVLLAFLTAVAVLDDLGAIITGIKKSFPLNLVVDDPKNKGAAKPEEKK